MDFFQLYPNGIPIYEPQWPVEEPNIGLIVRIKDLEAQLRAENMRAEAALPSEQVRNVITELLYQRFGTDSTQYPAGVLALDDWLQSFRK